MTKERTGPTTVWPEARPLRIGAGPIGVVMSHGFTGTVQSIAPWARALAEPSPGWAGARVVAPRLPGHGTSWRDMARTRWWDWYGAVEDAYHEVSAECEQVFVAGLSMGGALALRLAERERIAGVLLVNPAIATKDRRVPPARLLHRVLPPQVGVADDIALEGAQELAYPQFSATSLKTMTDLWRDVRKNLDRLTAPVLLMRSPDDHVVDDATAKILRKRVADLRFVELPRSYHVATLDHDAPTIFEESRRFIADL
ncbi:MAG: alpha/beta fold hydrolase [Arachnia sp.]